jgi:hypothetical protein
MRIVRCRGGALEEDEVEATDLDLVTVGQDVTVDPLPRYVRPVQARLVGEDDPPVDRREQRVATGHRDVVEEHVRLRVAADPDLVIDEPVARTGAGPSRDDEHADLIAIRFGLCRVETGGEGVMIE